ncbi:Deoxyribose-phosphate aldolase [Dirofilaria immitis]
MSFSSSSILFHMIVPVAFLSCLSESSEAFRTFVKIKKKTYRPMFFAYSEKRNLYQMNKNYGNNIADLFISPSEHSRHQKSAK